VSIKRYLAKRHGAVVLPDCGDYDIHSGQSNPAIFVRFADEILKRKLTPVIWEPFAGHTGEYVNFSRARHAGVRLWAYDLQPSDVRVLRFDSTMYGPPQPVGGVFFHPSYFGYMFCDDSNEVGFASNKDEYVRRIGKTVDIAGGYLVQDGLVCAIGSSYRYAGKSIRMDLWYLDLFEKHGFEMDDVWISTPDVVIVFRRK